MRIPTLEDRARQAADLLEDKFEDEIFPKIVFVHEGLEKYKELLKGLYIEGATAGINEVAKEFKDEKIYHKIIRH